MTLYFLIEYQAPFDVQPSTTERAGGKREEGIWKGREKAREKESE